MLKDEHADHKTYRLRWSPFFRKIGRDLFVQPGPINLLGQDYELVPHVDDLIKAGLE